jgi:hypothetical protein
MGGINIIEANLVLNVDMQAQYAYILNHISLTEHVNSSLSPRASVLYSDGDVQ